MNVFLSVPDIARWDAYFPTHLIERLRETHTLTRQSGERLTQEEWIRQMQDADAVITHWGVPKFTKDVLDACPKLKIIAHAAGTVAGVCSDEVFARGLTVLSANEIMSRYVAEAILGHMIAGLRCFTVLDRRMRSGDAWPKDPFLCESLFGAKLGFVGLGMVGRNLLTLLAPFSPDVAVYDPYIPDGALDKWPFAHRVQTLKEALSDKFAVSLHVSKTKETFHMFNAETLAYLSDNTLLVNCARGAVIDTPALVRELSTGRIRAELDVYEEEPLSAGCPLRGLEYVTMQPHRAGAPARAYMTEAIIDDLNRIARGEAPTLAVSYKQYTLMTHEVL